MGHREANGFAGAVNRRGLISGSAALGVTSILLPSVASASSGSSGYEGTQGATYSDVVLGQLAVSDFGPNATSLLAEVTNNGASAIFATVRFFKQPGSSATLSPGALTYLGEHSKTVASGTYWSEIFLALVPPEIGVYVARVFIGAGATEWSTQSTFFLSSIPNG